MLAAHERIVDLFSGGGGASTGIELALGRSPNVAINHDAEAVCMHEVNHPRTVHLCGDVWDYNPRDVVDGPVGLLWASPDCKHFSKAKGGAVVRSKEIRGLAEVVIPWAEEVGPRVIVLENVEEFQTWGPLTEAGQPDPERKGEDFQAWLGKLRAAGYVVEWRELRACDYGAPTTRKRLFLIARRDGLPIVWPEPTHGPGGLKPYRIAASCIDFHLPGTSIFDRERPLAPKTLARVARSIGKHVLGVARPYLVGDIAPTLIQTGYGERPGQAPRSLDLFQPLGTAVAGGVKHALVYCCLAKHYGGNEGSGSSLSRPFDTVTCIDHHALVSVTIDKGRRADVRAFLEAHGLTVTSVAGREIVDIGMRMLQPRELFRAQGFPDSYVIDPVYRGKPMTKTAQTRMCGNSVSPPMAEAIIRANLGERMAVAA